MAYRHHYRFTGKGPGGKNLCRWCGTEVSGRRRTWCSEECVEEFRTNHDWAHIRYLVQKRDNGICNICKTDTIELRKEINKLRHLFKCRSFNFYNAFGISPHRYDLWDADHIIPRSEGGVNHPDNIRTLCIWCHKKVTKELAARLAKKRKQNFLFNPNEATDGNE